MTLSGPLNVCASCRVVCHYAVRFDLRNSVGVSKISAGSVAASFYSDSSHAGHTSPSPVVAYLPTLKSTQLSNSVH